MRPQSIDAQPSKSRVPGKRETSKEKSLAIIREAHQKALVAAAALEGEIERLSHPLPQSQPEVRVTSKSRDCWAYGATECKRRHHQVWFTNNPAPCHPPQECPESGKGEATTEDLELGELLDLKLGVTSFLRGSAESSEEQGPPPELPVWDLCKLVTWKSKMTETPEWWRELLVVPGVPNCKRLVQKVWASFSHPKRASEVKEMKDHCQAPPAPPCLLRKSFQLPPDTIFACWDIREIWREKTITYAHAIQYWVEKSDLPTGGSHASWLKVWRSCRRRWSITSPFWTGKSLRV